jgi:DNA end-binding protein Ku
VMHTKEHLAALVPVGPALMLNTLRWASEIRPWSELRLPAEGKSAARLKDAELAMARRLVGDMTEVFDPDRYTDTFTEAVEALVRQRAKAGTTEQVEPLEAVAAAAGSNVIDLSELLAQSLRKHKPAGARKAASKRSSTRKRA